MEDISLIHTADTHIGYRQYHSDIRRRDFLEAFETVINDAVEMGVDAVIHAGDLFDSRNPTLEDILQTMELLSKLKTARIAFLAIVGNHESKQNIQWLDLFQSMDLAVRLGYDPYVLGDVAIYGIDSVPRRPPENVSYIFLVMHQLIMPFPFGEWNGEEIIASMPFPIDAILLGDYHKYEKIKLGDTWLTYPGSTERNSASEKETRGYNLITVSEKGIDYGRRNLKTRDFRFLRADLKADSDQFLDIFNTIKEDNVRDCVVFLEITGDKSAEISYNQIEEFILKEGAIACRINDSRISGTESDENKPEVIFSDPDVAVKVEVREMGLTKGGLLIDEIVRDMTIPKSNIDHATEDAFGKLLESMDFSQLPEPVSKTENTNVEFTPEEKGNNRITTDQDILQDTTVAAEESTIGKCEKVPARKEDHNEKAPRQYNLGDYL
jgi:DNA repair exonuclease SbcCD nuclease subunit